MRQDRPDDLSLCTYKVTVAAWVDILTPRGAACRCTWMKEHACVAWLQQLSQQMSACSQA